MSRTDVAALRLDRAIDALLRGELRDAAEDGTLGADEAGLAVVARSLHEALPRFHPRFGFEETLVSRLSGLGSTDASAGVPIPFPVAAVSGRGQDARRVWERYRRELVAGGAIASGMSIAIPIAGAVLVRWRRSRSSSTPGGLF